MPQTNWHLPTSRVIYILTICVAILFLAVPALAHEADQAGPGTHRVLTTSIEKIQSGLMFFKPVRGLQHRAISISKAERMGLVDAKVGDEVTLIVDEGNVLLDVHKRGDEPAGHRLVTGTLSYADPFWDVIELSTPEGNESFAVDALAGSKLSVLSEGNQVRAEVDEDNIVIDIHRSH
jgi:hypothetical protein